VLGGPDFIHVDRVLATLFSPTTCACVLDTTSHTSQPRGGGWGLLCARSDVFHPNDDATLARAQKHQSQKIKELVAKTGAPTNKIKYAHFLGLKIWNTANPPQNELLSAARKFRSSSSLPPSSVFMDLLRGLLLSFSLVLMWFHKFVSLGTGI